jgi:radical SAM superfamily enzyme YgiQ (UPF0313 family)
MKLLLINVPLGPYPTTDAPVAITRVMDSRDPARGGGGSFYDAYLERPSLEQIRRRVAAEAPDVIGISAILTHSYGQVKRMSLDLKKHFPHVVQVMGGEMATIANVVIRRTAIDFCVTGESEPTFSELLHKLKAMDYSTSQREAFKDIKGLVYLLDGNSHFTGYAEERREVRQVNYDIVRRFSKLDHYMSYSGENFRRGLNKAEMEAAFACFHPENLKKRTAQVSASIGCVAKCTFCHRFYKGYTASDPQAVIAYIEHLVKTYDIGTVQFWEENFGSNKAATKEIVAYLKTKSLNWIAGATRVSTIDEETIREWKEAGCVQIGFGIETGSQKMLDVMEKKTTVEQNVNALRWCYQNRVLTGALVLLGMPGETQETVDETIRNLSRALPVDIETPFDMAINFFQAIAGTPGFEYARKVGLIGPTLDDEERYLEGLFDVDASEIRHYLNFTDYEIEEVVFWRRYVLLEMVIAYMRKHGVIKSLLMRHAPRYRYAAVYMIFPLSVRRFLLKYLCVVYYFGVTGLLKLLYRKVFHPRKSSFSDVGQSLRKIVRADITDVREDDRSTAILRAGR